MFSWFPKNWKIDLTKINRSIQSLCLEFSWSTFGSSFSPQSYWVNATDLYAYIWRYLWLQQWFWKFLSAPRSPARVIIGVKTFFPAYCPAWPQFWFWFLQLLYFQLDGGRCVFRNLSASDTRAVPGCNPVHVYPYMIFHRPSWGGPYDGLASTGIQAVAETDSSHLQVQASNTLHICACTAVNAHKRGLVNMGEDAEASSAKHISFLQRVDVFKIKWSTRIAVIREWRLKPPPLDAHHASLSTQGSKHFIHILEMLSQGRSVTYSQAHKAWVSTNVWAEQHLLALFGEGLLCQVVLGTVTSTRSIVAVLLSSIISYIIHNNGANLAHRCRLLAFFS